MPKPKTRTDRQQIETAMICALRHNEDLPDSVSRICHAFSDEERKDEVRNLAKRVGKLYDEHEKLKALCRVILPFAYKASVAVDFANFDSWKITEACREMHEILYKEQ